MQSVRSLTGLLLLALCLSLGTVGTGCIPFNKQGNGDLVRPPAAFTAGKATPESLVSYLNDNARRIQSIRAKIDMDVTQDGKSVGPSGALVCEKPRNFRLQASVLGSQQIDIGSNQHELWFWIKQANPPYQYVCSHEDLAIGKAVLPFPFDPNMVLSALGMAEYDPEAKYDLKTFEKSHELSWDTLSADGRQVRRTVAFHRWPLPAHSDKSQMFGQVVKDLKTDKVICQARVEKVYRDRTGVVVPSNVIISYPAERAVVRLMLSGIEVNAVTPEDAKYAFTRRPIPGVNVYDLGKRGIVGPDGTLRAGYEPR
ncbi:MAG: hypothetical protein SNJ82_00340 [Gemmataceae bacterium]